MRVEELLTEIEPLPFKARCRRLADLRRLAGDPALAALLDGLSRRGHYERSLALSIASAVRDEASLAHLLRATRDPDAGLAALATGSAVRWGPGPEPFLDGLGDAPAAVRAALCKAVRKWRRTDLAEALIGPFAERWGDDEAAVLLPACGPDVVRERIDGLGHAVRNWGALGRAHPDIVLDYTERELAGLPEAVREAWWLRHAPAVAAALRHDPGRVVGLLERHFRTRPLPRALHPATGALLDAAPERMLAQLMADWRQGDLRVLLHRRSVRDRLARFGDEELTAVARAVREDGVLPKLLKALPPSRREAVFETAMRDVDRGATELGTDLLEVLPHAMRHREARRMSGLRKVAENPARVWNVAAFLPYEEALPVLGGLIRRPDADDRATGYALLIWCAGRSRDPAVLAAALESFKRLRNEQDPVRHAALKALASVPGGVWRAGHAELIARVADDALNARDLSTPTRRELGRIAMVLCSQGAAHGDDGLLRSGLELIERLADSTGSPAVDRLDHVLPRGREHRLAAMLAPRLEEGARRDDHRLALQLARGLGRRAHHVPVLQDALEAAALEARDDGVLKQAITLWLAAPGTRAERVGRVLGRDPSAIAVPAVLAAVAGERTDLLHLVLSPERPSGRFQHPGVVYVPRVESAWARRWTGSQRDAFRALLEGLAADEDSPAIERASAVAAIARFPGTAAAQLRPYFTSGDPYIRRVALTALPWTRSPQDVLPELAARADSDDAHVAVYAAARAARFIKPSELAAVLVPVLRDGKITARKEALRILLSNRVPDAMGIVAAAWDDPDQHRDVRAAIASAAREHLREPDARRILAEAARGPRDLARSVLGTLPTSVQERFRELYASLILQVARSEDPEARAAALPALPAWAPWAPAVPELLAGLLTDLETGSEDWRAAMNALLRCVTAGTGAGELGAAAAALAAAPAGADAEPERDLPALQRLTALAAAAGSAAARHRAAGERAVRALEGRLPEPLASELNAATLHWDGPGAGHALDALAGRCAGLPVLAVLDVAAALASGPSAGRNRGLPEPARIHPHAVRLAGRGDLAGGLLACALTERHGPRAGWSGDWRGLLRGLRAHGDTEVAYRARTIRTADE